MFIRNVKSSLIKSIAYSKTKVLTVCLTSGHAYAYFDVPRKAFTDFLAAESAGSFFNNNIKNYYECEEIKEKV